MKKNELKLLNLLSENARFSNKILSSKLKITPQGVSYAKKQLEEEHELLYTTIVDSAVFLHTHLLVGINLTNISEANKIKTITALQKIPEAITIWQGEYETDFIVEFCTKNLADFAKINSRIIHQERNLTIQFVFPIISKSVKLSDKKERIELLQSRKMVSLTDIQHAVLKELQKRPTTPKNTIAKTIGHSITSITSAKKELEKKGIIKGYSVISNHLEKKHVCILLRFRNDQSKYNITEHPVILKYTRNVIQMIGFYNCAIITESSSIIQTIEELRKEFIIDKHIVIPIKKVHKYEFSYF